MSVEREVRVVVVGASGCGKTKLINRFINNNYSKVCRVMIRQCFNIYTYIRIWTYVHIFKYKVYILYSIKQPEHWFSFVFLFIILTLRIYVCFLLNFSYWPYSFLHENVLRWYILKNWNWFNIYYEVFACFSLWSYHDPRMRDVRYKPLYQ